MPRRPSLSALPAAVLAASLAVALAACGGGTSSVSQASSSPSGAGPEGGGNGRPLVVMTRNLYVGGDLFLPFVAPDPLAAASTVWGDILASDVPDRMRALAAEIALAHPDLVGLQEAYRFVVTPLGKSGPVLLDLDFLALLQAALHTPGFDPDDRGLDPELDGTGACDDDPGHEGIGLGRYRLAVARAHTVLTVPLPGDGVQVTVTDRDAILAGPGVHVLAASGGDFEAAYSTSLAGLPVKQLRGWTRAEVRRRDAALTFVNVHLETRDFGPLQSAQADELVTLLGTTGPLVLAGDLNSSPEDPPVMLGSTAVPTPYQILTAGLADAWVAALGTAAGPTCCFPADLRPPGALSERIDVVLFRGGVTARSAARTGLAPLDALGGRWPSDHAGLVAGLRVPGAPKDGDGDFDGDFDGTGSGGGHGGGGGGGRGHGRGHGR